MLSCFGLWSSVRVRQFFRLTIVGCRVSHGTSHGLYYILCHGMAHGTYHHGYFHGYFIHGRPMVYSMDIPWIPMVYTMVSVGYSMGYPMMYLRVPMTYPMDPMVPFSHPWHFPTTSHCLLHSIPSPTPRAMPWGIHPMGKLMGPVFPWDYTHGLPVCHGSSISHGICHGLWDIPRGIFWDTYGTAVHGLSYDPCWHSPWGNPWAP